MPALAERLNALRAVLDGFDGGGASDAIGALLERLDRDLLPRTRLGDDWLVCAIVGPNNAGKSALFNGLVDRDLSPSVATGAATRRLVAAARADLADELEEVLAGGRFVLAPWTDGDAALRSPERSDELLLARVESVPPRVLLIDAPDFDSVEQRNRAAAEAVLATADLAICVVTKHTYQNAQVVEFLKGWLEGGRPWIAVYNEWPAEEVARDHLEKLASDLGTPPLARFGSPFVQEVATGELRLHVTDLDGEQRTLDGVLASTERRAEWKRAALSASLTQLARDAGRLARALAGRTADLERVRAFVEERARVAGREVARVAMPAEPFLAAFSAVIDRRRGGLRRRWHGALRTVAAAPGAVARAFGKRSEDAEAKELSLLDLEARALGAPVADFTESVAAEVGPGASERGVAGALAAAVDRDLARRPSETLAAVRAEHARTQVDLAGFQAVCEELVEHAIAERGHDRDVQAFMDLATLVPVAAAAATVFLTGGIGMDVAVASGGVATTALLERYSHLLDRGIAREARRLWEARRGERLGEVIAGTVLATSAPLLAEQAERCSEVGAALRDWMEEGA